MAFEDKNAENEELLTQHQKNIEKTGYKKYVVQIHNSYIGLLDNLTQDERNDIINDILATYSEDMKEQHFWKNVISIFLKILLVLFILLVVIPFFLILFNKSVEFTSSTNKQMEHNFEVLYQKRGR